MAGREGGLGGGCSGESPARRWRYDPACNFFRRLLFAMGRSASPSRDGPLTSLKAGYGGRLHMSFSRITQL